MQLESHKNRASSGNRNCDSKTEEFTFIDTNKFRLQSCYGKKKMNDVLTLTVRYPLKMSTSYSTMMRK
jgi:hypothetical protein